MSDQEFDPQNSGVVLVGPEVGPAPDAQDPHGEAPGGSDVAALVPEPAKVMRIGSMVKQLLDEVKAAPLDEASRVRMRQIHHTSITELEEGLAPELQQELRRISLPFSDDTVPSEAELRIAQAQLVGWLEGLFHGIQTALIAQQISARAQVDGPRALPGSPAGGNGGPGGSTGQYL